MKTIKLLMIINIFAYSFLVQAQVGKFTKKGDKQFYNYAFNDAIEIYKKAIDKGEESINLFANLADSYYENADMENAVIWYKRLTESYLPTLSGEYYFRYAQALKGIKKYDESDIWMSKLAELNVKDSRGNEFKYDPEYLKKIEIQSNRYEVELVSFNTEYSEFAPAFNGEEIVFSSNRNQGSAIKRKHAWTGTSFLELYKVKQGLKGDFDTVEKFNGDFNKKLNESTVAFTQDGNTMYFTRNSYDEVSNTYIKDSLDIVRLKLYIANKVNGEWGNIKEFPYNSSDYSIAHPTLSSDGKHLYFASDMPGTYGLSDIFVVDINEDGSFSKPQNLGSQINTEGRDTFPFIDKSGKLYFASDGHIGLGGLDVFICTDINKPDAENIYNVGKPLNSEKDDFAFIIDQNNNGYFTSNRHGGIGNDDIYRFKEIKPLVENCKTQIRGVVKNGATGESIANADVYISIEGKPVTDFKSDTNGAFSYDIDCSEETKYSIRGSKTSFIEDKKVYTYGPTNTSEELEIILNLQPEKPVVEIGTDLFELLDLKPIYFDYDKSFIRSDAEIELKKIIAFMKEHPTIKIDVRSHTDSRGRDAYNLALSERRNKSTKDYILTAGKISIDRITGKGYGETQLKNKCKNGVKCTKEEHQLNRRSEFIVIEN
ncbi:OmpA family protein [Winogradskyella immobilis]|uniref:PD40 domain-containing protein n=1 Tax=Winogradskyella immobilis TaxID=2816852 RepID=A0ABS8EPH4_9FLAO|nr:OmpA family protein [Winogradskyella immobilis]MCC1485123.1 PD40 domain-containing protein [Winogradskyella immobilis]MCG0017215.1 OmpA family protein [Winogradskyella immobilis]